MSQAFGNGVELVNQRDPLYRITQREYHKSWTLVEGFNQGRGGPVSMLGRVCFSRND